MPGPNANGNDENFDRYPNAGRGGAVVHDGSIADADFKSLVSLIEKYGPTVVVQKVAKVCTRKAETLGSTWEGQSLGAAYSGVAAKIKSNFPNTTSR